MFPKRKNGHSADDGELDIHPDCPVCHIPLHTQARHSVPIEVCASCGGTWAPPGALDAILSRAIATGVQAQRAPTTGSDDRRWSRRDDDDDDDDRPWRNDRDRRKSPARRLGKLLKDLFD